MAKKPVVLHWADWAAEPGVWHGKLESEKLGTNLTILFDVQDKVGVGPTLHVHDYDEIFIILKGRALFTIGDQEVEAQAGDILMGPAQVPHKYHSLGPDRLETTNIHLSKACVLTRLDDPDAD